MSNVNVDDDSVYVPNIDDDDWMYVSNVKIDDDSAYVPNIDRNISQIIGFKKKSDFIIICHILIVKQFSTKFKMWSCYFSLFLVDLSWS